MTRGPMDALVIDAHLHPSLWGIRALGEAGVTVRAMGPARSAAGLWSRAAQSRAVGPDVETQPQELGRAVAALAMRHGPLVVYPSQEESIDALVAADLPDGAVLPWPPDGLAAIRDKRSLARLAAEAGIATPEAVAEAAAGELRGASIDGPCVVKPVRKAAMARATVVRTTEELRAVIASVPDAEPLLLQRRADGDLTALTMVVASAGRPVARFQQRALRTWPPDAGGSSLAVGERVDEELATAAARMLAAAGFSGLVQLQFMSGAGPPQLIDANPRFYGSLPLALASGLNLPALWHALVTGGELPNTPPGYATGVRYRNFSTDLTAALHGRPGVLLRRVPRPRVGAMWDSGDPLAGGLLAARTAALYCGRQLRRAGSALGPRRP